MQNLLNSVWLASLSVGIPQLSHHQLAIRFHQQILPRKKTKNKHVFFTDKNNKNERFEFSFHVQFCCCYCCCFCGWIHHVLSLCQGFVTDKVVHPRERVILKKVAGLDSQILTPAGVFTYSCFIFLGNTVGKYTIQWVSVFGIFMKKIKYIHVCISSQMRCETTNFPWTPKNEGFKPSTYGFISYNN